MLPAWHPHFDVWAIMFILGSGYWYADRRIKPHVSPLLPGPTTRQWWQWYGAIALIGVVSGWPIHDLAEEALFTAHMVEHMVIALLVPPLLLMGTPQWLADATLGHRGVVRILRPLSRPVPAFVLFNLTYIVVHWPNLVAWQVGSEPVHFMVHTWLFFTGVLMWMPVLSPTRAIPKLGRPAQMLYLFLQSLLPTIPASFITFSSVAIYPVYGNAALAYGLTPVADQTIAGIIMKLGGGLIIWVTIAVIWFRWTSSEREWESLEAGFRAG